MAEGSALRDTGSGAACAHARGWGVGTPPTARWGRGRRLKSKVTRFEAAPMLNSCVVLGEWPHFPEPQFPCLCSEGISGAPGTVGVHRKWSPCLSHVGRQWAWRAGAGDACPHVGQAGWQRVLAGPRSPVLPLLQSGPGHAASPLSASHSSSVKGTRDGACPLRVW